MGTIVSGQAYSDPTDDQITAWLKARNVQGDTGAAGTTSFLETYANEEALELANVTYDANKIIASANVIWPDGTPGVWTTTSASAQGYLVYTVTYVGATTKTVTVQVTRDSDGQATTVTRSVA